MRGVLGGRGLRDGRRRRRRWWRDHGRGRRREGLLHALVGAVAAVAAVVRELGAGLGRMVLEIEPPTARVMIDGVAARANESVEVDPGRHVVIAEAEGFASETRTVEVARGAHTRVVLRMVPAVLSSRRPRAG